MNARICSPIRQRSEKASGREVPLDRVELLRPGHSASRPTMSDPGAGPVQITMIIAVLDAACDLPALLISIERQRCPPSEVVVTDRGSTDETVTLLQAWAHPSGMRFRVIKAPGASVSEARNLAIEAATFDHIVVTHGAVILDVECVARLWGALTAGGGACARGASADDQQDRQRECVESPPEMLFT